jgi:TonB family protein
MKTKLFFLILLFLIPFGCKEEKLPEIINLNDDNYLSERDLGWNFLINTKLTNKDEQKKLFGSIDQKIKTEGLNILPNDRYQLMIYLNEKGKFDKVIILNGKEEKVANIVVNELSKVFDKPVYKDGLPIKFQFTFWYSSDIFENLERGSEVDSLPLPIGGMYAIQKNIRYPEIAKRAGIEGTVLILAEIDEGGNVINTSVREGIGAGCDEAAIDAIKSVKFKPAIRDSVPVRYRITIPIKFKLQ